MKFTYKSEGQGPPLVFLNASGLGDYYWKKQLQFFPGDFNVIILNCKGYGASTTRKVQQLPFAETFEEHADYILEFFAEQKLKDIHLIGHSFGSIIALFAGIRRQNIFSSLHLIEPDSILIDSAEKRILKRAAKMSKESFIKNMVAYVEKTSGHWLPEEIKVKVMADTCKNSECYKNIFSVLSRMEYDEGLLEEWLSGLSFPVTVIYGGRKRGEEAALNFENNLFDRLPRSRFDVIDNCGHNPMLEKPALFNRVLQNSLKQSNQPFLLTRWS
ncbi:alpha/beta fold hydrolase [Candidatus Riflebacteria bacterium]